VKVEANRNIGRSLVILVLLALGISAMALQPPTEEQLEQYWLDGTLQQRIEDAKAIGNHRIAPQLLWNSNQKIRAALGMEPEEGAWPPDHWIVLPSSGNVKVFTLLIDFADHPHSNDAASIDDKMYGQGLAHHFPEESHREYYLRSSYGMLDIGGSTLGWYTTPYDRQYVEQTTSGREALIWEALQHFDSEGHDFTQYDNDGDGVIEYFLVIWTGPHGDWATFWWGYQTSWQNSARRIDGKRLGLYSWQWEAYNYPGEFSPYVTIHETGHALGLPDYYDYDDSIGPRGGVGNLDQMDGYGDHGCFSKFVLGWLDPVICTNDWQQYTLRATGDHPEALLIPGPWDTPEWRNEYFMVQNRYRTQNDVEYPNDGLVIWHVNAFLDSWDYFYYDNSYTDFKLLRLMEADGLEEIENYGSSADAGDYYTQGDTFGPSTFPDSSYYDGSSSGASVRNIGPSGPTMTFEATGGEAVTPPSVTDFRKKGNPFRFKIYGGVFQYGCDVYIDGQLWGSTTDRSRVKYKSETQLVLKKGKSLKNLFPKGAWVPVRIVNPNGGEVTIEYDRGSKQWRLANWTI